LNLIKSLRLLSRQRQWRKLSSSVNDSALSDFYQNIDLKFNSPYTETNFLAADLEMTGLDSAHDHIVSIGFVPIIRSNIALGQARHILIASNKGMGQSATIHHIRDQDLHRAVPLSTALNEFFTALKGKVLLLHHAPLDFAFLTQACQKCFGATLSLPVVDTLQLEHQRLLKRSHPIKKGELRLFNCRRRYNLADMPNHNALSDALATAELFLAITAYKGKSSDIDLSDLIRL